MLCRLDRPDLVDIVKQLRRSAVDSLLVNNEDRILQVACRLGSIKEFLGLLKSIVFRSPQWTLEFLLILT